MKLNIKQYEQLQQRRVNNYKNSNEQDKYLLGARFITEKKKETEEKKANCLL